MSVAMAFFVIPMFVTVMIVMVRIVRMM